MVRRTSESLVRTAIPLDNAKAILDFCCPFSRLHTDSSVNITASIRQSDWFDLRGLSYHFDNLGVAESF